METYRLSPIRTFQDALEVRKIRNESRMYMTRNNENISIEKQREWYFGTYKPENNKGSMECFLLRSENNTYGFALVRNISGRSWITIALKSSERGRGLGKVLLAILLNKVIADDIWLDVLESNLPALKLYQHFGFKKVKNEMLNGKKINIMKLVRKKSE